MGMVTKKGKYFANPAIGRAHERDEEQEGGGKRPERSGSGHEPPEHRSGGSAHSVHIFRDENGAHHTVAHHPHGVEHEEHGSLDEAMDHAKGQMEGEGEKQPEPDGQESGGLMQTLDGGY